MTKGWVQLVGGSDLTESGGSFITFFSGAAESRAWKAFPELEAEVVERFDGAAWLRQGGFDAISVSLSFKVDKRGHSRRKVTATGRTVEVSFPVVWPGLETAAVPEIREYLWPVLLEALALAGEKKGLGPLPQAGTGGDLKEAPLKPLVEDPLPYAEEPGDSFVIFREFPQGMSPKEAPRLIKQYEKELEDLLSDEALENLVETDVSLTDIRWVVQWAENPDE